MNPTRALLTFALVALLAACGEERRPTGDGGTPGSDSSSGSDSGSGPVDLGVLPDGCVPMIEICGDHMDQNCDGRDTSCGDTDMDGIQACRAGDDLTMCDCDDARTDVRPPFNTGVPGAPEICDGRDNDCNGRVDESAACCSGCASLGEHRERADICTLDGTCDCSTEPGTGACEEGQACCTSGCTDLQTDFDNCGFCGAQCTDQADRCTAGNCACGDGAVCDFVNMCVAGSCG